MCVFWLFVIGKRVVVWMSSEIRGAALRYDASDERGRAQKGENNSMPCVPFSPIKRLEAEPIALHGPICALLCSDDRLGVVEFVL